MSYLHFFNNVKLLILSFFHSKAFKRSVFNKTDFTVYKGQHIIDMVQLGSLVMFPLIKGKCY